MFACPHCQFENPIQNRFCQRCGNALRGLRAIVTPVKFSQAESCPPEPATPPESPAAIAAPPSAAEVNPPSLATMTVADLLTEKNHFKAAERYQLRHPQRAQQPLSADLVLDVIDCEPATEPPIAQHFDDALDATWEGAVADLIPPAAIPYWTLQENFFPMVPELQAAWQIANWTVIVIEDRSTWKTLADLAHAADIEPLELVHWFYEMVNLWEALKPFKAEASLLEPDNLKVDDDQILCIERLIYHEDDHPRPLQDLGKFWQSVLQAFPDHAVPPLRNLVADIGAGVVNNTAAIEEILANIAENLEPAPATDDLLDAPITQSTEMNMALPLEIVTTHSGNEKAVLALSDLIEEDYEEVGAAADTDLEGIDDSLEGIDDSFADLPTMALPMKLNRLEEHGRTHVGRQRKHNEDFFFAETQLQRVNTPSGTQLKAKGIYILCDGMGGHSGGEVASALAVKTLRDYFDEHWHTDLPDTTMVTEAILKANQVIFDQNEAEGRTGNARMGTTLVMVLIADTQALVAHVGDSRLYCLTRQGFDQVTVDHEVGQREVNRGVKPAIAYARPDAYQLTQALGPRNNDEVVPTVNTMPISQDTLLLLCSDGLSDNDLLENHLDSHIKPLLRSRNDLEEGVADLIDLANEHNGHDNITAIAVRIKMRPNLEAVQNSPAEPTSPPNLQSHEQ